MKSDPPEMDDHEPTYQDVLDAPPEKVAQIIDGKFYLMTRPAPKHVRASSRPHPSSHRWTSVGPVWRERAEGCDAAPTSHAIRAVVLARWATDCRVPHKLQQSFAQTINHAPCPW